MRRERRVVRGVRRAGSTQHVSESSGSFSGNLYSASTVGVVGSGDVDHPSPAPRASVVSTGGGSVDLVRDVGPVTPQNLTALWAPGPSQCGRFSLIVIRRGCGFGTPLAKSDTSATRSRRSAARRRRAARRCSPTGSAGRQSGSAAAPGKPGIGCSRAARCRAWPESLPSECPRCPIPRAGRRSRRPAGRSCSRAAGEDECAVRVVRVLPEEELVCGNVELLEQLRIRRVRPGCRRSGCC